MRLERYRLEDLPNVLAVERARTAERLVEDHPERPDVRARVDVLLSEDHLRRHVLRRADDLPGAGGGRTRRKRLVRRWHELRDAEVEHLHDGTAGLAAPPREEDVV